MAYAYDYPRPAVTADVVPFAWREGELCVLLIRRKHPPFGGAWALPGGFLDAGERAETCARRELTEETGLHGVTVYFLGYYDEPDRDPRGRTITLAFVGIVAPGADPRPGDDAADVGWHPVGALPALAFDHERILLDAAAWLRLRAARSTVALGLLPPRFSMPELHALYESVCGGPLDRRRLARRLGSAGVLAPCKGAGRARRYRLRAGADAYLDAADRPLVPYASRSS